MCKYILPKRERERKQRERNNKTAEKKRSKQREQSWNVPTNCENKDFPKIDDRFSEFRTCIVRSSIVQSDSESSTFGEKQCLFLCFIFTWFLILPIPPKNTKCWLFFCITFLPRYIEIINRDCHGAEILHWTANSNKNSSSRISRYPILITFSVRFRKTKIKRKKFNSFSFFLLRMCSPYMDWVWFKAAHTQRQVAVY